jgi:hypothetical protein
VLLMDSHPLLQRHLPPQSRRRYGAGGFRTFLSRMTSSNRRKSPHAK